MMTRNGWLITGDACSGSSDTADYLRLKMTPQSGEIYILRRDGTESKRLDKQHEFIQQYTKPLFEEFIPPGEIFSIADIGTGTGIWLHDVAKMLRQQYPTDQHRRYHGFDISADQFPNTAEDEFKFTIHNVLTPFPAEEHGRYDLVHVRFLLLALAKDQYQTALSNLTSLLKPGGYLQWEEFDNRGWTATPHTGPPVLLEICRILIAGIAPTGISLSATETVLEEVTKAKFDDTTITYHSPIGEARLQGMALDWLRAAASVMMSRSLLRTREESSDADAVRRAETLLDGCEVECPEWALEVCRVGRITGRKAIL